ncbi:hypothetical protein AB1A81_12715 [Bdellovibrio bacteriovorus]|nr:hypothetical protein [Bdellovibrio bacteriovorus]AHZ85265.1 hypothetical protein EP01_09990 [Bdellovibrio bacteriovorus]BEV69158.1 hypothetical protein Bb109J_c2578 [Bdellovibrio bacteriovorus]
MDLSLLLQDEFEKRRRKNPRYSLRAFANSLNIDAGSLARVMSGQRVVKDATARQLMTGLQIPNEHQILVLSHLEASRRKKKEQDEMSFLATSSIEEAVDKLNIYILISLESGPFCQKENFPQLAQLLNISIEELQKRLLELERLGLLSATDTHMVCASSSISNMTLPLNPEDLPRVRDILKNARKRINVLTSRSKGDKVLFNICTAAFPV